MSSRSGIAWIVFVTENLVFAVIPTIVQTVQAKEQTLQSKAASHRRNNLSHFGSFSMISCRIFRISWSMDMPSTFKPCDLSSPKTFNITASMDTVPGADLYSFTSASGPNWQHDVMSCTLKKFNGSPWTTNSRTCSGSRYQMFWAAPGENCFVQAHAHYKSTKIQNFQCFLHTPIREHHLNTPKCTFEP